VELTERKYALPTVSRTFEGRDRFAPAAAYLAKGIALVSLGKGISNYHVIDLPAPAVGEHELRGEIVRVDRFGNLITNIDRRTFDKIADGPLEISVGGQAVTRVVSTYADVANGEVCALFGSTDHLEVAANGGSAARALDVDRGVAVRISRRA
jgi:S-adenosylmethionine hydrolase